MCSWHFVAFCIAYQSGTCQRGDKCNFKHEKPTTPEGKQQLMESLMKVNNNLSSRARSASPVPKDKKKTYLVKYCVKHANFLRGKSKEDCTDNPCKSPHLSLEDIKAKQADAKAKAKAKS